MKAFVDTNVLLYLLSSEADKADRSEAVLTEGIVISAQVLNEFANAANRKFGLTWTEVRVAVADVLRFAEVRALTLDTHLEAVALADRYRLAFYDASIVASALQAGCSTLWSEDFQTGQRFLARLTVKNPFH